MHGPRAAVLNRVTELRGPRWARTNDFGEIPDASAGKGFCNLNLGSANGSPSPGACPAPARRTQHGGRALGDSHAGHASATWPPSAGRPCQPASPGLHSCEGMRMWVTPDRCESCLGRRLLSGGGHRALFLRLPAWTSGRSWGVGMSLIGERGAGRCGPRPLLSAFYEEENDNHRGAPESGCQFRTVAPSLTSFVTPVLTSSSVKWGCE